MKNIFDDANNVNPNQNSQPVEPDVQPAPNLSEAYAQVPTQNPAQPYVQGQYPYPNPYANAQQPQSPYAQENQPQPQQAFAAPIQQGQAPTQAFEQPVNPYAQMPYPQNPYYAQPYAMPYPQAMPPYGYPMQGGYAPAIPPEQMQEMVEQYLKTQNPQNTDSTTDENGDIVKPKTRVIFQSEDFDAPESEDKKIDSSEINLDSMGDFLGEKPSEEEVSEASLEFKPEVKQESSILTTELGEGFSVYEVEITEKELNVLSRKHPVKVTVLGAPKIEPVSHSNSVEYSEDELDVQEIQYDENGEPIEKLSTDEDLQVSELDVDSLKKEVKDKKKEKNSRKGKKEKTKLTKGEIARRIILAIAILGIIGSCAWLGYEYLLSANNDSLSQELSDMLIDVDSLASQDDDAQDSSDEPEVQEEVVLTEQEQWQLIYAEYPNIDFPDDMLLQYANLYATNQDMVGYLSIDGLDYSTPIVQGVDDDEYIATNFYGESTKYACPFMTYLNNSDELDMNTVIFGHNMNNGSIFAELNVYKTIDGYLDAPVISFDTLTGEYEWKIIAVFITNAYESDDNGYAFKYYFTNLSSEENFSLYLSELESRSLYDTGVDVLPTDKLLTLSTCSYEFDDARFVVVARMVRLGESSEVNTSLATVNSNVRYPQAYYDAKGLENSYVNAYQWIPS